MHRIIHGTLYERQPQACGHTVRIHDLGRGHVEVVDPGVERELQRLVRHILGHVTQRCRAIDQHG